MADSRPILSHGRALAWLYGLAVLACTATGGGRATADEPEKGAANEPTAESVLRRATDFFKKAESIAVTVEKAQKIGPIANRSTMTIAVQRPNRLAARSTGGMAGMTLVCDGKTLSIAVDPLRKYTQAPAPGSLAELLADPIVQGAVFQTSVIGQFLGADPYTQLMDGVTSARYAGLEMLDGAKAHHLKFAQEQVDWELWVSAEGDPTVRKAVTDLSKAFANVPGGEQFKNQKMEAVEEFKDWRIDQKLDGDAFTFQPPRGMQKVDSLFERAGDEEAPSPLVGEAAPDVSLKLLDKGEFRLEDHRGEHVVMLDFWATWCGPCVQELPILAGVARDYKEKGVVFCAINEREEPADIRKFLKEKKLDFTVALDAKGEIGQAYGAQAIPLLVLIDKKGIVRSVHVGYSPSIKATLRKELDALLAGKELAKASPHDAPATVIQAEGLEHVWTVKGPYTGVAADAKGQVLYALQAAGRCDLIDPAGTKGESIHLQAGGGPGERPMTTARFARWGRTSEGLVTFGPWGQSVLASRSDGTKLWEETGGQGIDDVWAADLDGDGTDEVIVGYNGSTGLHVFSASGKRLWKREDLGNVWHVCAGDLDGDGQVEVVTTSAEGKVHVFAPGDGHPLKTIDAGLYANMVRVAPGRSSKQAVLLIAGAVKAEGALVALGGDGKDLWTLDFPDGARHCDSLTVSPDGAWAALGLRGGTVSVVDLASGRVIAQLSGQGTTPATAWTRAAVGATPLLVTASGRALSAFRIKKAESR
ncbi:MAG: DUF2092 domain-containing protein [Isosphaeraceae bacterium]|nr:DUF2092 domain-containing protein [Isosphaeraceae bacterium]